LKKNDDIELKKELEKMLERIREENAALFHLIEALRKTEEPSGKKIIHKSNQ